MKVDPTESSGELRNEESDQAELPMCPAMWEAEPRGSQVQGFLGLSNEFEARLATVVEALPQYKM